MKKHPNEFTGRQILKFFADRHLDVQVVAVDSGYVIFFKRFNFIEACTVDEPAGRLVWDERSGFWKLYWMSGRSRWHVYDRYEKLNQALEVVSSDQAANLFHKVL